jgi:hypothetical protein
MVHLIVFSGFLVLISGTFTYNSVIRIPYYTAWFEKSRAAWLAEKKAAEEERKRKAMQIVDEQQDAAIQ